ncbi:MAG: LysR substrate-binding domain-containing protein, partial [Wenzhouxiangella sp.]|nr:LysR substrate-binding domain-containing protein [Wenzhouxiangella sp.]
ESIFDLGTELLDTLRRGGGEALTELRVGAVATLSRNFQQNLLRPLIGNPSLHLVIESASLEELIERLRVHKLDLVLSNRPVSANDSPPLNCRRIARQTVCLVGPPRPVEKRFRFPDDVTGTALLLPGHSSEVRTQFELLCEGLGLEFSVAAEVDDMAMLRLLARDSGRVAVVPEVVVQDELELGLLQKYCELPEVQENFYAITARRHFRSAALKEVLDFG